MKTSRVNLLRYAIYLGIVILFTFVKLDTVLNPKLTLTYIFRYNHVFDICLIVSIIGYFYYHFYNNVCVQTRLDYNGEKNHFMAVFKEFCILLILWLFLLIIYDFSSFSIENWSVIISIYLLIITNVILFLAVHFLLVRRMNKYYKVFIIELISLCIYRFYFQGIAEIGNYNIFSSSSNENYFLVVLNLFIIVFIVSFLTRRRYLENVAQYFERYKYYLVYIAVEAFSSYYLMSAIQKKYSYSFFDYFFITSNEKFTGFIFWLIPKVFIVFVAYKRITETYRHNLIFYLVRIDDRSRWVGYLILNNIKDAFVFTIIKSIITALMYGWNIKIIESGVSYMLLVLLMILIINIIYLLIKKEEVLNYLLIGYLTIATIAVYGGVGMLSWIMLETKEWTNLLMLAFCVLFYFITVLMLKRDEYYV